MSTKYEKVLEHLKKHGSITSWEAITKYRATRLSDIIFRLRKEGHIIETLPEKNTDGAGTHAKYIYKSLQE